MTRLNHIMIDLETRGTKAGCIVLSIGAVEFNPLTEELGKEFYTVISTPDSKERFLREETGPNSTMEWWGKQSEEARKVLAESEHPDAPTLPQALAHFNQWLSSIGSSSSLRIYGNGADFDNPILIVAYDAGDVKPYFGNWGGRCYRTLKNLDELFGDALAFHRLDAGRHRTGTHHNALDDAKSQALHLMANLARIRGSHSQWRGRRRIMPIGEDYRETAAIDRHNMAGAQRAHPPTTMEELVQRAALLVDRIGDVGRRLASTADRVYGEQPEARDKALLEGPPYAGQIGEMFRQLEEAGHRLTIVEFAARRLESVA